MQSQFQPTDILIYFYSNDLSWSQYIKNTVNSAYKKLEFEKIKFEKTKVYSR